MLKRIDKRNKSQPPFTPKGGCVPYAIAAICNDEQIIDMYPAQDEQGKPISHDFYHASMMFAQSKDTFCFFRVLMAQSRYYDNKGVIKCPNKTISFEQFSRSATVFHLAQNWKNKDASKFVFLLETYVRNGTHAVGMILNILDGRAAIIDRKKEHIIHMDIGWVFSHYRVLRVAILHGSHNGVSVVRNDSMDHLAVGLNGAMSDVKSQQ